MILSPSSLSGTVILLRGRHWAITWHSRTRWRRMQDLPDPAPLWGYRRYQWPDQPGPAYELYCFPFALRWIRPR